MAYHLVRCGYCGVCLGLYHNYQQSSIIRAHFRRAHPKEFKELEDAKKRLIELRAKYKFRSFLL